MPDTRVTKKMLSDKRPDVKLQLRLKDVVTDVSKLPCITNSRSSKCPSSSLDLGVSYWFLFYIKMLFFEKRFPESLLLNYISKMSRNRNE